MKILIFTPRYLPQINGNTTTVERLVDGLEDKGIYAKVVDLSVIKDKELILETSEEFNPDIIHGFHALKGAVIALEMAQKLKKPLITTITGTDVNHDLFNPEKRKKVAEMSGLTLEELEEWRKETRASLEVKYG